MDPSNGRSSPGAGLTAGRIADLVGGELIGPRDLQLVGVAPLDRAGSGELSFLVSRRYLGAFRDTGAGLVLVPETLREAPGPAARLVVADPHRAMAMVIPHFHPEPAIRWGIDPSARIGPGVRWRGRIAVGPGTVIGAGSVFGADCRIDEGAVVGADVRTGDGCRLGAGVTVADGVELGDGVQLHPGARVGTPGFGYVPGGNAPESVMHVGRCVLGHGVRVGANTTIDRGSVADTVIGNNTKIDNLVQIGHNCRIGAGCFIMAQVGMAGSTIVEDDVVLAGQAGLAGHLRVGRGARVAAQAGVIGDIPAGTTVSDYPARPHRAALREAAALRRLPGIIDALEAGVEDGDRGPAHD